MAPISALMVLRGTRAPASSRNRSTAARLGDAGGALGARRCHRRQAQGKRSKLLPGCLGMRTKPIKLRLAIAKA
jgi:hypothetical protein|eukprot:jgi/Chrpa1/9092/Chrysochromulina_OHIO_Genome00017918-RA